MASAKKGNTPLTLETFKSELLPEIHKVIKSEVGEVRKDVVGLKKGFSQVRNEMASVRSDVRGLKKDVVGLKKGLGEVRIDVAEVKTELTEVRTDVAEVKRDVLDYKLETVGEVKKFGEEQTVMAHQNYRRDKRLDRIDISSLLIGVGN